MTMEITNDRLEEAIKQYAAERTKENLTTVLNLLRPTKLYVPAMLKAPDQPTPCFLKNNKGEQFFVAYTSKEQMPEEPKSQALLFMPFPACNNIRQAVWRDLTVRRPWSGISMCRRESPPYRHPDLQMPVSAPSADLRPCSFPARYNPQYR